MGNMKRQLTTSYAEVVSVDNLLAAWREFLRGKRGKRDVQEFQRDLMDEVLALHRDLQAGRWRHGGYHRFTIADPKPRVIHKAAVRDRLLHHALYRQLYPFFDRTFIADSFSCRKGKGTHRALDRFRRMAGKVSRNHTRTAWVLTCDVRRFFDSVDHGVLCGLLAERISNRRRLGLLKRVVTSFEVMPGRGLPLGNLTSQLLVNVYMNEFDQFMKHRLRARHYLRYADDFAVLSDDREYLMGVVPEVEAFLGQRLRLRLHQDKVRIQTMASGLDWLGWIHFPHHRVLRTTTKRRMFRNVRNTPELEIVQSYLGLLSHGSAFGLREEVQNYHWLVRVK